MKKALIITPRSPFLGRGADEQDRLAGIEWFIKKNFEVRVITKTLPSDLPPITEAEKRLGIKIFPVSYKRSRALKRLFNPNFWDGAAYEYFDKEIQDTVYREVSQWRPDLVWVDYTYLWPLYHIMHEANIPIITRSINYEPEHFLQEDGNNFINRLRARPKIASERRALKESAWFFAISPNEAIQYRELGGTRVSTLPLRALPTRLIAPKSKEHERIRIGFMPSTYTVHHNKEAFKFVVEDVVPALSAEVRDKISIHVTGNKFPKDIVIPHGVHYEGFVPSSIDFWQSMDIALAPSLFGAGMQQKIFEPLALGVPTITSSRGLVGYPFRCGVHLLCAENAEEVRDAIVLLANDPEKRKEISRAAQALSQNLFPESRYDELLEEALHVIFRKE